MAISLKRPDFSGQKILIIILAAGIIIVGTFLLFLWAQRVRADLDNQFLPELTIIDGNSLAPISTPPTKEPIVVQNIKVLATAYSSTVWQTDSTPFITASGTSVRDGVVANNLLPMGTKIRMPEIYGDKIFVVEDRMHSRKGSYHVDIWFPTYLQAKNFGAQKTYIEVLEG